MNEKFNPAQATRAMFTEAITRALNDMTDTEIETLVQQAVGSEMSQRQMADLALESTFSAAIATIRSEMTQKASTESLLSESVARNNGDITLSNQITMETNARMDAVAAETAAREAADAELHNAVGAVAALGAKNLFNIDASAVVYSCTYTHANNVLAISGTGSYARVAYQLTLRAGKYVFAANVDSLSASGRVRFNTASAGSGTTIAPDIETSTTGGVSQQINLAAETTFYIMFYSNTTSGTGDSAAVYSKIMIRRAEITDDTYVPYAATNRELYVEKNQLQASLDQITGLEKQIPSNADLNTYTDPGVFQILSTSVAQTIANIPTDCMVAGSIEVKRLNGNGRIQFYYPNWASSGTNPGSFYFRQRTGTSLWTGWYYFSGTQSASASTQSAPASLMQMGRLDAELSDAQEVADDA